MTKLTLILLIISSTLVACVNSEQNGAVLSIAPMQPDAATGVSVNAPVTILFATHNYELPSYEELVRGFEEANPAIKIKLVSIEQILDLGSGGGWPEDAGLQLASAADVFKVWNSEYRPAQYGWVRDLRPLMEADSNFEREDFYPNALEQYELDGRAWGIPTALYYQLIFYSKNIFDGANVSYPQPGWTWSDFLSKAEALTQRQGEAVTRWGFVTTWGDHAELIESRTGSLIRSDTGIPSARFTDADVVEAVRWYVELYLEHNVMPLIEQPSASGESPGIQLALDGRVGMWPFFSGAWYELSQSENLGVAPFPVDTPDSHSTPMLSEGLVMSAGTQHPNEAWRWMDFLSRHTVAVNGPYYSLPSRRSTAESTGFWEGVAPDMADTLRFAVDHSQINYSRSMYNTAYQSLNKAIGSSMKGERNLEDALTEAQTQATREIQEIWTQAADVPEVEIQINSGEALPNAVLETIIFDAGTSGSDLEPYRVLSERFHQTHPGITVEVKAPDFSSGSADLHVLAEQSDCFQWYPYFEDTADFTALLSLNALLELDSSFDLNDYFPAMVTPFTIQGQLWGLPAEVTPYVVEYNKTLFDASGVSYPQSGWDIDDFLRTAVALTKGDGETKQYGFVGSAHEGDELLMLIQQLGGKLINNMVEPPVTAFDDPATIEAVRWYAELYSLYGVRPLFITSEVGPSPFSLEREQIINSGRAAMWITAGARAWPGSDQPNIGIAQLPVARDGIQRGSYATINGYFVSAHTEKRQACWQWITFLSEHSEHVRGLPARRSVAESDSYRQRAGVERVDAYIVGLRDTDTLIAASIFENEYRWLKVAYTWLVESYRQIAQSKADTQQAMTTAQSLAESYRACVVEHQAFLDLSQQQVCLGAAGSGP